MPEPLYELVSFLIAALISGILMLPFGWPWRQPRSAFVNVGWVLSVAVGFYVGWFLRGGSDLQSWPKWPPQDNQGRLLLLLLPVLVVVELVGAFGRRLTWYVWPLRGIVAFAAARVLLHESTYLSTSAIPDDETWTATQAWSILGGLGAALLLIWGLLSLLAWRVPSRSIPLALALTCAGSSAVIMLSGYLSGGKMSLMLAYSLIGATTGSLLFRGRPDLGGSVGFAVVGLFSLLLSARFFADLTTTHALVLFFAPLLCWLPSLTPWQRTKPVLASTVRLILVAVPIIIVAVQAYQVAEAKNAAASSDEYSSYKP